MQLVTDKQYEMDEGLIAQSQYVINAVADDFDGWIIIDGEIEGAGKSVLGIQLAYYLDPTLTLDRVVYTADEFRDAVHKAKKGQAIVWDEASEGTNSSQATSTLNATLQRLSEQIRQKNLFIILIRPYVFDFTKYFAIARSWFLLTVDVTPNPETQRFERGSFRFYNRIRKQLLYLRGKKEYDRTKVQPNFVGKFTKFFPLDLDAYKAKKAQIRESQRQTKGKKILSKVEAQWGAARLLNIPYATIAEYTGTTRQTVRENVIRMDAKFALKKALGSVDDNYVSDREDETGSELPYHIEEIQAEDGTYEVSTMRN